MSVLVNPSGGYSTARSASSAIWHNCPEEELLLGRANGTFYRDDFLTFAADSNLYEQFATTPAVAAASDVGELAMATTGTDNSESYVQGGIALTGCAKMVTGGLTQVWYETRLKLSSIADQAALVGLVIPGYATTTDALGDDDGVPRTTLGSYVGFRIVTADPNGWDAVYATAGTALTVHQEAEATDAKYVPGASTYLQNAVADTWVKLGLYSDGYRCYWFVNGLKVNDTGVALNATNFPDNVNLHALWAIKTGEAVAKTMTVDWVKVAYLINT